MEDLKKLRLTKFFLKFQRGNPVLKNIRSVPWEYSEIVPDYEVGAKTCALFLSIRYYNLHPDYIHERLKELKQSYALRILLVLVCTFHVLNCFF